jgi:hypothetical protein
VLLGCVALLVLAPAALAAEGTGKISGTVTEATKPLNGLQNIEVTVYEANEFPVGFAITKANGEYTVEGLPSGSYKVRFSPAFESGLNYAPQYYEEKSSFSEATPVLIATEGEVKSAINARLHEGGKIEGRVTEAAVPHNGLQKIEVTVYELGKNEFPAGSATTNASGEYTVVGLPSGSYRVAFSPGFESGLNYVTQYYEGKSSSASANLVVVTQGITTPNINAKLEVGGEVSGTVTDASTHAAMPNVGVFALGAGEVLDGFAITNGSGQYTIVGLATNS